MTAETTRGLLGAFVTVPGTGLEVMSTPVTADAAAAAFNALRVPDRAGDSYTMVNVVNPDTAVRRTGHGPFEVAPGRSGHPATGVTLAGARAVARLHGGRLPRVDEWVAVLAAGGSAVHDLAVTLSASSANFDEHWGGTTPVDRFGPQVLGLHDVLGNVGEWCEPSGPDAAAPECPVFGGGWNKPLPTSVGTAVRRKWSEFGAVAIGFRIVRGEL